VKDKVTHCVGTCESAAYCRIPQHDTEVSND